MSPYREMDRVDIPPKPLMKVLVDRVIESTPKSYATIEALMRRLVRMSKVDEISIVSYLRRQGRTMIARRGDSEAEAFIDDTDLELSVSPWGVIIERFYELEWSLLTDEEKIERGNIVE